jgi:EmrB/QacA subfamily drug resistance transporter
VPWVLLATILGSSMDYIDGTVVNVALPSVQRSFAATGTQLQWVVEAYALFLSSLLLTGGSLGDRFGRRKMFLCGVLVFACASLGCGVARHIGQLLFARCLQGIGGALLVPNSLALLSAEYEGPNRARAIGTWSGFSAIMTGLGPVLGGWLVQHGSWRWAFFLNLPIAVAAVWITLAKVPNRDNRAKQSPLDTTGALLVTASLASLTYSLLEWPNGHPASRICGIAGLILLAVFVITECRSSSPLIAPQLFLNRNFTGANLLTFFLYGALAATLFYLPLNLIQIQAYTPAQAGAAMLPMVLLMFFLSPWAGGLLERWGARLPLILGPILTAIGYLLLARPQVGGSYWLTYFPAIATLGLGMTISVAPLTTVVMSSVDENRTGIASGTNNAVSQISALLAIALSAPLFFAQFSTALKQNLSRSHVSSETAAQVEGLERQLGAIQTTDAQARHAIDDAFVAAFRLITLIGAGSAAAAGCTAILAIRNQRISRDPERMQPGSISAAQR